MRTKKNYEALFNDLKKHEELIAEDSDLRFLGTIKDKIFTYELIEKYGWIIPSHITGNINWFRISNELSAGTFGGDSGRTVAWEDNSLDPDGEFLLCVSFCTGPYFLGEDYDKELFKEFFLNLTKYGPKFKDTRNNTLYFSKDKAGSLLRNYYKIVDKYRKKYKAEENKRKVKKLREELQKLESNN